MSDELVAFSNTHKTRAGSTKLHYRVKKMTLVIMHCAFVRLHHFTFYLICNLYVSYMFLIGISIEHARKLGESTNKEILSKGSQQARFYCLPKIHKLRSRNQPPPLHKDCNITIRLDRLKQQLQLAARFPCMPFKIRFIRHTPLIQKM